MLRGPQRQSSLDDAAPGLPATAPAAAGDTPAERVPLGPSAVATLKAALRQALHLGHNYIGTEHILLGLVDGQDAAGATLERLGVTRAGAGKQIAILFAEIAASRPGSGA